MLRCAMRRTRRLYALMSLVNSCAASGLAGLLQLGSVSMLWIISSTVLTLWTGLHLS